MEPFRQIVTLSYITPEQAKLEMKSKMLLLFHMEHACYACPVHCVQIFDSLNKTGFMKSNFALHSFSFYQQQQNWTAPFMYATLMEKMSIRI